MFRSPRPLIYALSLSLLAGTSLSLSSCSKSENGGRGGWGQGGPASVGTVTVTTERFNLTQELSGRTSAFLIAEVRPQVSGIVLSRNFTEGGTVRKGQSLYTVDPAPYQATYNAAVASRAQAEANREAAKLKADRAAELIALKAISQQDYEDAQTALKAAEATLAVQTSAVETARINLGYTRVNAPISGRVGKSSVTPGALVTASQANALATVQDLSQVYVDITQSSNEVLRLKQQFASGTLGETDDVAVTLILEDGTEYPHKGRLQFSDVSVAPGTGQLTIRALFPNPDGLLLPGMFVRARISTAQVAEGIKVPALAVKIDARGEASVMVIEDGKAVMRPIKTGAMIGRDWQVLSGLKAGEQIVVEGGQNLRPGAEVKPYAYGSRPAAEAPAGAGGPNAGSRSANGAR